MKKERKFVCCSFPDAVFSTLFFNLFFIDSDAEPECFYARGIRSIERKSKQMKVLLAGNLQLASDVTILAVQPYFCRTKHFPVKLWIRHKHKTTI